MFADYDGCEVSRTGRAVRRRRREQVECCCDRVPWKITAVDLPNRRFQQFNIDDVVVMLDAECSFKTVSDPEVDIYWGAYIGTEDEILVSGNLKGRMHDIERIRREAKGKKGWIMDTYLLRKTTAH
jgi:precorrin-2 methylase